MLDWIINIKFNITYSFDAWKYSSIKGISNVEKDYSCLRANIYHHYHHVALPTRVSLILSRYPSLSSIAPGKSSRLYPVSAQSCCIWVLAGRPAFARTFKGVNESMSLMSSPLLLYLCPACLVRLTWIVFVMGSRWSYSCSFVECVPPGLFQYCLRHSRVISIKLFLHFAILFLPLFVFFYFY